MKIKDLKQLTKAELLTRVSTLRGIIRDLRFTVTTRQHSKVRDLREAKKELAVILTLLNQEDKSTEITKELES
ncbi:MAG: 50S ribosomal protein L29 [Patescibacteria group bacterium]|nr:50S ribosomal protein L29 [Patescibacteria group bacterium]